MEKHSVSRLSYLFAHLHLLSSDLFSSDSSHLCFSTVHIVGSFTSKLPSMIPSSRWPYPSVHTAEYRVLLQPVWEGWGIHPVPFLQIPWCLWIVWCPSPATGSIGKGCQAICVRFLDLWPCFGLSQCAHQQSNLTGSSAWEEVWGHSGKTIRLLLFLFLVYNQITSLGVPRMFQMFQ